jgi:hypothetical protein
MMRAVIWRRDAQVRAGRKTLDTGHDLRMLLAQVRHLGLLREGERDDELIQRVQRVARLWSNDMRFAPSRAVETRWRELRVVVRRATLKRMAAIFFEDCAFIIRRCELLCEQ